MLCQQNLARMETHRLLPGTVIGASLPFRCNYRLSAVLWFSSEEEGRRAERGIVLDSSHPSSSHSDWRADQPNFGRRDQQSNPPHTHRLPCPPKFGRRRRPGPSARRRSQPRAHGCTPVVYVWSRGELLKTADQSLRCGLRWW